MPKRVVHEFSVPFAHGSAALWSLISDTQRINETIGNPKYEAYEVTRDDGAVDVFGRLQFAGYKIEWLEVPVNWIENRWFEQIRRFLNGPLVELSARLEIFEIGDTSRCDVQLSAVPRHFPGGFIAQRGLSRFEKGLRGLLETASEKLDTNKPVRYEAKFKAPAVAKARAAQLVNRIETTPYGHGLARRVADHILTAQEIDLWSMRPLALARDWDEDPREMVEVFLQAVREGLLESRWDLLCPRCRVSKEQSLKMQDLPAGVHCPSCNIDYEADFASNVELAFSPGPAVRPVEFGFFCRSGPAVTPHIKGQITLEPGQDDRVSADFLPGDYRLRTLEAGAQTELTYDGRDDLPGVCVTDTEVRPMVASDPGILILRNASSRRRTVIVEDRSWRRDVLTAERVTTLQAFRDLFSDQVLRAGDEVTISTITFMFTDLTGSTSMFAQIGDAPAYQIVREHFGLLGAIVREHDGTIVKTIGDGLHAAFNAPDDALRAGIAIQSAMADWSRELKGVEVGVRVGLHTGSSISVNLNERLDYYGNTVNMAARLEGQGESGDITVSKAIFDDVAVKPILSGYEVREGSAKLKGFDETVAIFQIRP